MEVINSVLSGNEMLKIVHAKSAEFQRHLHKVVNRGDRPMENIEQTVRETLADVRSRGDVALLDLTQRYNGVKFQSVADMKIAPDQIEHAWQNVDKGFLEAFRNARQKIYKFHEKQRSNSWFSMEAHGVIIGQRMIPLKRIGIYVTGGHTVYPSTALLNAIPAQLAGVKEIYVVTPSNMLEEDPNPYVLAAAKELNIEHIYRVGGAQAIGALAYGTQTIPQVDKIIGPGDVYVSLAKKLVQGYVGTDMILGPSEVVILADESAYPKVVAADLLSQAEKDEMSAAILITNSRELAEYVALEVELQYKSLGHSRIIRRSLEEYGIIFLVDDLDEGIQIINQIAPQQLGVITKDAWQRLDQIENAGAVFIGPYSPEVVGDYLAGPSHILPTGGAARFHSPLSVNDFLKTSHIVFYTAKALKQDYQHLIALTAAEGFEAQAKAVERRFSI